MTYAAESRLETARIKKILETAEMKTLRNTDKRILLDKA